MILMRPRRLLSGNNVLFDATDVMKNKKGFFLMRMIDGPGSYMSPRGTVFWRQHPFQWVIADEVGELLGSTQPSFDYATVEQAQDWYSLD